jgi:ribosomal protein S18 acetylase RimI-like enzyme
MIFSIRAEEGEADHVFMLSLNKRLVDVSQAPTHSEAEVAVFQEQFTASAWSNDIETNATFVAVGEDGRRLGYVNVRETADEIGQEKCGYIALLAIVAEAEGKGVAQALVSRAENWSKQQGFSRLSLDVFASNQRAQQFYKKAGYQSEMIRVIKQL